VTPDQVAHSPTPAKLLTGLHDKHVLVVGQEHRVEIVKEYPFQQQQQQQQKEKRLHCQINLC